jgi:hypothetical protein
MKCSHKKDDKDKVGCNATAMRQGTKGRAYCFAHESHAWDEAKKESRLKSAACDDISEDVRMANYQERIRRAI